MKKVFMVLLHVIAALLIAAVLIGAALYCYYHIPAFRQLFGSSRADVLGAVEPRRSLAAASETASIFSLCIFAGITVLQFITLYVASLVIGRIRRSPEPAATKLKMLANADIFLDLPLYVGLFGSVSSFMVMTFSPSSSQLIAYSSTLIGIIFSTIMRLVLVFPFRSRLLRETAE